MSVQGMRTVITGAASGIGRATAGLLQTSGAKVFLSGLKKPALDEAVRELTALGGEEPDCAVCDVRKSEDCSNLVVKACEHFGEIDALVHCAGVLRAQDSRPGPLHELDDEEYEVVVGTNLKGTFLANRAVLKHMVARKKGQILNVSSISGRTGLPLASLYSASKAGIIALSESTAEEVRPFGIRVQVILPDAVDTPLWDQNGPIAPAPTWSLKADRVAEVIVWCLGLPPDTILKNMIIEPFRSRRMKASQK